MRSLFISDLHLTPGRPDITRAFFGFLDAMFHDQEHSQPTLPTSLYILGDFFEYWIGDDVMDEFQQTIAHRLQQLVDAGHRVYFMHGNRDFLVGQHFCQLAGCTLLMDPTVIHLVDDAGDSQSILLMHGDSLCTEDKNYQRFRRLVRRPWLQQLFLTLPSRYRRNIARKLRADSIKSHKPDHFVDVSPQAVTTALDDYKVGTLLHGHTHKAAIHALPGKRQRIVLGDWHDTGGFYARYEPNCYHNPNSLQLLEWTISENPHAMSH